MSPWAAQALALFRYRHARTDALGKRGVDVLQSGHRAKRSSKATSPIFVEVIHVEFLCTCLFCALTLCAPVEMSGDTILPNTAQFCEVTVISNLLGFEELPIDDLRLIE